MLHRSLDMKVGYRRVSSLDQNLDRQELVGVEKVFEDKVVVKIQTELH